MAKKMVETLEENVKETKEEKTTEKKTPAKKAAAKKTTKKDEIKEEVKEETENSDADDAEAQEVADINIRIAGVNMQEVIGGVIDARPRHQREDARQQKYRDRGLVVDREEPCAERQRQRGDEHRNGRGNAQQVVAEDVDHPAHRAGQAARQIVPLGHVEGDAKAAGGHHRHHKLRKVVGPEGRTHTATPNPCMTSQPSTTPQAMLPAISTASSRRMEPER